MIQTLFYLIAGHLVADYPLQTDFIAKFKSRSLSLPAVPWYYVMSGHCGTHALAVALVTDNVYMGCCEFVAHFVIDCVKCEGMTNIHVDQALHVLCKILWLYLTTVPNLFYF